MAKRAPYSTEAAEFKVATTPTMKITSAAGNDQENDDDGINEERHHPFRQDAVEKFRMLISGSYSPGCSGPLDASSPICDLPWLPGRRRHR